MTRFILLFSWLGALCLPLACGEDDDSAKTAASGTCEDDCDHQVAAGCPRTPAGYAESCKSLCAVTRQKVSASCQEQLKAQEACAATKATYTCVNGQAQASPVGACASEGAACLSCNGALCSFFGGD